MKLCANSNSIPQINQNASCIRSSPNEIQRKNNSIPETNKIKKNRCAKCRYQVGKLKEQKLRNPKKCVEEEERQARRLNVKKQ